MRVGRKCIEQHERIIVGRRFLSVWRRVQYNHKAYSPSIDRVDDLRFLTLGLVGEAGELANKVKKQWGDSVDFTDEMRLKVADLLSYTMMVAATLDMTPADLIAAVAHKQQVFVEKMKAKAAREDGDARTSI